MDTDVVSAEPGFSMSQISKNGSGNRLHLMDEEIIYHGMEEDKSSSSESTTDTVRHRPETGSQLITPDRNKDYVIGSHDGTSRQAGADLLEEQLGDQKSGSS